MVWGFIYSQQGRFSITQGNKLYVSEPFAYDYKYLCDLSGYAYGGEYGVVLESDGKLYVCPINEQNILVIDSEGKKRKIELKKIGQKADSFNWAVLLGQYIILFPRRYPAIVKYDTITEDVQYITDYVDKFLDENGVFATGGAGRRDGKIYLPSTLDRRLYVLDEESSKASVIELPFQSERGYRAFIAYKDEYILLPCIGEHLGIGRWNPETNEVCEYDRFPEGIRCVNPITGVECTERPFSSGVIWNDDLYLTPDLANMYVKLNLVTGEMAEWKPPFDDGEGTEYFNTTAKSIFPHGVADENGKVKIFSYPGRKLYELDLNNNTCREFKRSFSPNPLDNNKADIL